MAITKTNFINYSRCPRYVALEEVKKNRLDADISYDQYIEEELEYRKKEILSEMFGVDDEGNEEDLIDVPDQQLEVMMPYYKKIEELAGKKVEEVFGGKSIYAEKTKDQKSFEFKENGIKYLCYVDIYNENEFINIIEVKATTSNSYFINLQGGYRGEEKYSLFYKDKKGIFHLKEELDEYIVENEMPLEEYNKKRDKLLDKTKLGKYVYDLAVQRMIIEKETKNLNINYYLAILNHEYIFDGKYDNGQPVYSNDIINIFDFTKITKEMQETVIQDKELIKEYLMEMDIKPTLLGDYCEYKKNTECKYCKICFDILPKNNSSLSYIGGSRFKDKDGNKHNKLDLVNEGYYKLLDVPEEWIEKRNHFIQRDCLKNHKPYIDKKKINIAIDALRYPIYHLDFETFPCPLPRFIGEKCYSQSTFQFSLHIERSPGECDLDKDHFEYLSSDFDVDCREELIKKLCQYIKDDGTVFAQNVTFEKTRLKELSAIFPEYSKELNKMIDNASDLLYIVKNNRKYFEDLRVENADVINYYHEDLSGSYSIKKTLPVFSDLKYDNLDVKNGTEAIVTYAKFQNMSKEEKENKHKELLKYCKLDTWAMVVILNKLREISS